MGKDTKPTKQKGNQRTLIIAAVVLVVLLGFGGIYFIPGLPGPEQISTSQVLEERIDVDQAYELYNQGTFTLDVRTVEEWQQAHIPGATLIPLDQLAERYQELPGGEPILIYCRSGNRSFQALTLLKGLGLENLSSMEGGINEWIAAGYPIE